MYSSVWKHYPGSVECEEIKLVPIDVLDEILDVKNKSFNFGLSLGLPARDVQSIRDRFSDPIERLTEILIEYDEQIGLKWGPIIEALRSSSVNCTTLAKKLDEKHCSSAAGIYISSLDGL